MATDPTVGYDAAMRRIAALTVDVEHLQSFDPYLAGLGDTVPYTRDYVQSAHDTVGVPRGADTYSALGSTDIEPVGRPQGVDGLLRRLEGTREVVMSNLADVASSLAFTAGVMRQVAEEYKTADERNRIAASEIEKRLRRRG